MQKIADLARSLDRARETWQLKMRTADEKLRDTEVLLIKWRLYCYDKNSTH